MGQGMVGRQDKGGMRVPSVQKCPVRMGQGKGDTWNGQSISSLDSLQAPTVPSWGAHMLFGW